MPSPDSYNFYYNVGSTPPTATTVYSSPAGPSSTLSDTADATADDMTDVGQSITWSAHGGTTTLYGFNDNGDPIVLTDTGTYYIFSDSSSLAGTMVTTVTTTGTYTYCFAAGTQIATPDGERCVETLAIGDTVRTETGDDVAVKWVGRQTLRKLFAGPHMQPVRIRAGALGESLPHTDLIVTADHGMVIDGFVINASALINGTTIEWVPLDELPNQITYHHVETDSHDVILANGAPAETFMDATGRKAFDNYQEYIDLYSSERIIPEMGRLRISAQRLLPEGIKTKLGIEDNMSVMSSVVV